MIIHLEASFKTVLQFSSVGRSSWLLVVKKCFHRNSSGKAVDILHRSPHVQFGQVGREGCSVV